MNDPVEAKSKTPMVVTGGVGVLVFLLVGQAFAVSIATDIVTSLLMFGTGVAVGRFGLK
jgi:hypothetical protein